ncbi:MAG: hypothetical protein A2W93_06875 [Bacteroidetes bacterium GWF2_43_63]|nr:MAG: hypothetical protein A2W94_07660 [Bacteroidetes bacterium GWE2_42_42]OFY53342.1 MAG: hypothetical protein A2W93_06875 [Bacteroidetes bacterium GWF2_43_63]HBG71662.1 hypothetical protein [Bacteroidales bacterium]HCB61673.1 hypothetical protein [Bacteroidales bacterium]HCY22885.1 hypothetical protein [Bacteroidales bacterium]
MKKIYYLFFLIAFIAISNGTEAQVQQQSQVQPQINQGSNVVYPVRCWLTKPIHELTKETPWEEPDFNAKPWVSPDRKNRPRQTFIYSAADGPEYGNDSSIIQTEMGKYNATQTTKAIIKNWAGIQSTSFPPDPTGAVGPNHYIQSVNATTVRIFDKNGATIESFLMGTLFGETSNAGDPIIMYDRFADRWFISQFGSSNEIFIAISQTNDPTGAYYAYEYVSPQFPDYLKFSIWHDGYYMTSNQSTDKVYVFERSVMLTGGAGARGIFQTFTTGSVSAFFVPLPADAADNQTLPTAGTPLPFFAYYDNAWGGGVDGIKIWNATTNWTTGVLTISAATQINTSSFDASYDPSWDDVPQPNGVELDGIGGVLMYRAPWRSWSGYNNVVLSWGVKIAETPRQRAIMWCELRQISGVWSVYQQGIYAPDTHTRWMSSATMDDNGSIGLCYAKSSTTIFPGLFYTGRLAGDPLGTMTLTETQAVAGTGSQSSYNRFGDYSHTALDPDGITFWHTGEYVTTTSGQETRVYSFQIPAGPLAPVANFTADATAPFCSGTVQFTDMSSNIPTSWLWTFGDGQTSTSQNPSHTYAASGTYNVSLKATNALGNNTMTKTSYITITLPTAATATGASRCGTGTVTLTATGANTIKWYDAATGGNLLGTGTSFTTPSISATTTYYVENNIPETSVNVGPALSGSTTTAADYLIFDVYEEMTLVSVVAQRQTNSTVTISLQNSTGATLQSTTVTIGTTATTVPLNWVIPAGTGYRLVTPASSRLVRLTSGVTYPYTLSGIVSITGSNSGSTVYPSYFNWTVQGAGCSLSRVPAVATINTTVTPSVAVASSATSICSGTGVTFTATPTNGGTPTYQWQVDGANVGTNSATYTSSALTNGDVVTCIMTSTASCATPITATSTGITMTVNPVVTPSIAVAASASSICAGTSVTFTATPTNGGTPTYQWKLNGSNVGTGGATYTNAALTNGNIITCVMTSTAACVTPTTATSTGITMTVNPVVTPSVAVSASATSICSGTNVTFTAAPTNGGTPTYQWKLNGANVGTGGTTYSNAALASGDVVTCVMTSTATCATPATATSTPVTMTVNTAVTPSVAVSASATSICSGTSVTFTATPTNGGTPTYQWKLNGGNVGGNSPTYTNAALANSDVVTCVMTSSATCASPTSATSTPVTMSVSTPITASVAVAASATSICSGTSVTFTATPTNGGTPTYQWKLNGANVGTGGTTYTNGALNNGDIVTCVMTSTAACVTPTAPTSNPVTMTVNTTVTPSVAVAASATTICTGTSVTFTATPANGGTPTYQWKLNGGNVGTGGTTYTNAALADGDVVTCVMTSTATCASPTSATSTPVAITVSTTVVPSVAVAASASTICSGTSVTFTATPTNGGTPTYQWKLNGANVGGSSPTYTNAALNDGDVVTCVMTSTSSCASPTTATSTPVTMTVSSSLIPAVAVAASATTICSGTSVTFTASPINGGTPTYQWKLNGTNVGGNSATYTNAALNNSDVITCVMTSTESCASPTSATSTPVTMTVSTAVVPTVAVSASATSICSGTSVTFTAAPTNGGTPAYQWKLNGSDVGTNSPSYTNAALANGDIITCVMTSSESCATPTSATATPISMTVNTTVIPSVAVAASATSICSGTSVTFNATPTNGGTPTYQWKLNGSNVGPNSATYTNATLNNGDVVTCVMTSSTTCASPTTATSTPVAMTVSTSLVPSVAVSATSNSICSGTSVTFTAAPTNGGTPSYQWLLNGASVGSNSSTYTNALLNNGDAVTCVMTSSESCASPATATSLPVNMTVSSSLTPTVSVSATATSICSGTPVMFTAIPVNGGTPTYQWKLNGTSVGSNSATYNTSSLNNGDVILCEMTSSESCASPAVAASGTITMTVSTSVTPTVSIAASTNSICYGTPVTFTATPINGGTPSYQWTLNGANVGSNSPNFASSMLQNGDVVTCTMISTVSCASASTASSNNIAMIVNPAVAPSVSITSSTNGVCEGTAITFTAAPVNGGSPSYQWLVNGANVGSNMGTFTSTTLSDGDIVSCVISSTAPCVSPVMATSNTVAMEIYPNLTPSVAIASQPTGTVCPGTVKEFTAVATNGGTAPTYEWFIDGVSVGTGSTLNGTYSNGQVVSCTMTSAQPCVMPAIVDANPITVSTYNVTAVTISDNGGSLTSSSTYGNQWYEETSGVVVGAIGQTFNPLTNGVYYVVVTDANGCTSTSNSIDLILESIDENGSASISFFPNPTSGNLNVTFIKAINNGTLKIENAIGELVFEKNITQTAGSVISVDFGAYAPGSYFVTVKDAETEIKEQVIYEK